VARILGRRHATRLAPLRGTPQHSPCDGKNKCAIPGGVANPQALEADLRAQHLSLDVTGTSTNAYGVVYEIEGAITTPSGRAVRFCSVWQIDTGAEVPRFITMYPR
jgi:hypothetical protein